jgi:ferrous iron transport protein A
VLVICSHWQIAPANDNRSHQSLKASHVRLDHLPLRTKAHIASIDWAVLRPAEARRLRELGFDEGMAVELLHHGPFGRDPMAVRVGRMTVAVRRAYATAIEVDPVHAAAKGHATASHSFPHTAIAAE